MDMGNMAQLFQMLMSQENSTDNSTDESASEEPEDNLNSENSDDDNDFSEFFNNINFDMISKMGELFSRMNKPDMNGELLLALRPHLRNENRHKIDSALKLSRMISMLPFLKDSGILNDLL